MRICKIVNTDQPSAAKMKVYVLFCFLFVSSKVYGRPTQEISEDMPDILLETMHDAIICARQIGPDAEALQAMETEGMLPENNEEFNEYFGCIWKRKGIIDNDSGQIDRNNLRSYLLNLFTMGGKVTAAHHALVDDVMEHCENVQENNHGLTAVKTHNCVLNRLYSAAGGED